MRSKRVNLVVGKPMIGRGEICNRKLENRLSACHIVRASVNAGCHCYQEGREEIGNQARMGKMKP